MRKKVTVLLLAIFTSILCITLSSAETKAIEAADIGRITDKAKIADLKKCHDYFADRVDILKLNRPSDIVADPGSILALPNGTTSNNSLFNCKTLMNDYMGYSFNDNAGKANFLKSMGYTVDAQTTGNKMTCKTMTFTRGAGNDTGMANNGNGSQNKLTICASGSQGIVSSISITRNDLGNIAGATFNNFISGNVLELDFDGNGTPDASVSYRNVKVDDFFSELETVLKKNQNSFRDAYDNTLFFGNFAGDEQASLEDNDDAEVDNIYKKGPLVTNTPTVFTEDERLGLLVYYFLKYGDRACYWQEGSTEVTIGENKYYVTKKTDAPSTFYVVNGTSWFKEASWEDIINDLNGKDISGIQDCSDNTTPPGLTDGTSSGALGDEDDGPCFDGGVGSLGWIICPIIKLLRQTTENLYDYVITPFLEIDMGAFDTGSAVFKGWQMFQSVANIVFVILLLLVIFSQLTGYGIDNYGIKRMLPKLIIGAILVNLSFIICQLLVDASNIIGFSVENLFNGWASDAMKEGASGATVGVGRAVGATIISGAVGIGSLTVAAVTAEIWLPVLILPLLLGTVSIIISCLFVFIILGARRAAAVILVVIAPLAFVMYMLPNTKKLFDRWFSAFKAVLLVFPIVGLLMGGGAFAGAILWNVSSDFFLGQLLAALTTVIPFFFIPRILKSSLNTVGNLGTMLSNASAGLSRGLGGIAKMGVGNSNWYKNLQDHGKDVLAERNRNREQARAQRIVDRMKSRGGKNGENLTEAQRRRQYVAQATLNRLQREDVEAEAGLTPISREVELAQAQAKRRQESISAREDQIRLSGDVDNLDVMRSQLASAITGGDEVAIEAYQNVLSGKGEQGRQAVHNAMVDAEANGNVSAKARKAYASNIMNGKFANDYKNNSRSTFEYAKANAGSGSGGNMASYYGSATDSLTQQKMVDMDEAELTRYLDAAKSARQTMSDTSLSVEERSAAEASFNTITSMASGTLNNQRLTQGLKGSQRKVLEEINSLAPSNGGASAAEGQSFQINNDANRSYDAAMERSAAGTRRKPNNSNPVDSEGLNQYLDMNDGRS